MGSFNEQDSIDPDDPELDYTPLRLSERAAKLGPSVSQRARPETVRSLPTSRPALVTPNAIKEPPKRTRDLQRRAALLGVAARVAAVAGAVAIVALLFVIMKPLSHQSVATSTPPDITASTTQSNQPDVESKPPPAELKAPVTSPPEQPATHEESQQLLQGFLQWREKTDATEPSR